jgi:CHU_C Type IX secretion signal domain
MKYLMMIVVLLGMTSFVMSSLEGGPYSGCCGAEPVEFKIGNSIVYVPNVFTPNSDGLNDVFRPFYNDKKVKVTLISIANTEGNTIWETKSFSPEKPFSAWTGRVSKDSVYTGLFYYTIFVDGGKGQESISGSACSVVCNPKIPVEIEDKEKCFFPMQYVYDSVYHKSPLYLESAEKVKLVKFEIYDKF